VTEEELGEYLEDLEDEVARIKTELGALKSRRARPEGSSAESDDG
jgi:hypothetical protein